MPVMPAAGVTLQTFWALISRAGGSPLCSYIFAGMTAALLAAVFLLLRRLDRAVARTREQARELEEARRQEALGTLAGGIAHDFNNILGSILGFGALLEDDLITQPELQAMAQQITLAATATRESTQPTPTATPTRSTHVDASLQESRCDTV